MTKPTVTDEIMTQAIHAAIKETGLLDIISNLDVELKAAKEENARLLAENRELRIFATDIVNKRQEFFYPIKEAVETASFDFFKHVNSKFQALNKEPNS
jgi:hypothetical protein